MQTLPDDVPVLPLDEEPAALVLPLELEPLAVVLPELELPLLAVVLPEVLALVVTVVPVEVLPDVLPVTEPDVLAAFEVVWLLPELLAAVLAMWVEPELVEAVEPCVLVVPDEPPVALAAAAAAAELLELPLPLLQPAATIIAAADSRRTAPTPRFIVFLPGLGWTAASPERTHRSHGRSF